MPALYANKDEVKEAAADAGYVLPADTGTAPTDLDRLIERAQIDVDSLLGDWAVNTSGTYAGLKLEVTTLDYAQQQGLQEATIAQVLYRREMGEKFFVRPQFGETSGPEFSTKGRPPRVSPAAKQALSGLNLIRATTSIANRGSGLPRWYDFSYNVTPASDGDYGGLNRSAR